MGLGAKEHLLYQGLRHSIKDSCKTETEMDNTNKIYSADLNIKRIYEILNKTATKEHSSAKLKYINSFNVTIRVGNR